jgi:hypothetical protein
MSEPGNSCKFMLNFPGGYNSYVVEYWNQENQFYIVKFQLLEIDMFTNDKFKKYKFVFACHFKTVKSECVIQMFAYQGNQEPKSILMSVA